MEEIVGSLLFVIENILQAISNAWF